MRELTEGAADFVVFGVVGGLGDGVAAADGGGVVVGVGFVGCEIDLWWERGLGKVRWGGCGDGDGGGGCTLRRSFCSSGRGSWVLVRCSCAIEVIEVLAMGSILPFKALFGGIAAAGHRRESGLGGRTVFQFAPWRVSKVLDVSTSA